MSAPGAAETARRSMNEQASNRRHSRRRHRQGSRSRRTARARGRRCTLRHRPRFHAFRLELRSLRPDRPDDAGGLVRDAFAVRGDFLRRRRLARDGSGPRLAVGVADPVPPPLRPVRQHAPVPADARHRDAACQSQAGRHRLRRRARKHRRRVFVGRRAPVRGDRARDRVPGIGVHAQGRRSHPEVRVRARGNARGAARHVGDEVERHLDHDAVLGRALQGDGRAIPGTFASTSFTSTS